MRLAGQGLEPSYPTDNIQKHETRSRFQPGRGKNLDGTERYDF